jgi:DNA-binding transcriptional ArsR family regulator
MDGERSVSKLAQQYDMSFAAVQKHVAVLERAELVRKRSCGRERLVSGNVATVRAARDALDQLEMLWRARVERMNELLTAEGANP